MLNGYIWWIRFVKYSNPYAFEAHDIFQIHQYGPVKECKIQAYAGVSIDLDVCVCVCGAVAVSSLGFYIKSYFGCVCVSPCRVCSQPLPSHSSCQPPLSSVCVRVCVFVFVWMDVCVCAHSVCVFSG